MKNKEKTGIRNAAHMNVDKALDKVQDIRDNAKEGVAKIKDNAMKMKGNVDESIRENPEKSVLIAAGAGAVIGAVVAAAIMKKSAGPVAEETLPA